MYDGSGHKRKRVNIFTRFNPCIQTNSRTVQRETAVAGIFRPIEVVGTVASHLHSIRFFANSDGRAIIRQHSSSVIARELNSPLVAHVCSKVFVNKSKSAYVA